MAVGLLMAGTGDLEALRLLRSLRERAPLETTAFGVHVATHMGIGRFFCPPVVEKILVGVVGAIASKNDYVNLLVDHDVVQNYVQFNKTSRGLCKEDVICSVRENCGGEKIQSTSHTAVPRRAHQVCFSSAGGGFRCGATGSPRRVCFSPCCRYFRRGKGLLRKRPHTGRPRQPIICRCSGIFGR